MKQRVGRWDLHEHQDGRPWPLLCYASRHHLSRDTALQREIVQSVRDLFGDLGQIDGAGWSNDRVRIILGYMHDDLAVSFRHEADQMLFLLRWSDL